MSSTRSEISAILDGQSESMRTKDIDRLMAVYAPDVVYFDVVPPLRFVGAPALRQRFAHWFDGYDGPIDMQARDRTVTAGEDMAVAVWLSRAAGTLKTGQKIGSWVRVTSCWRRSPQGWLAFHEHVSLPVDVASGRAVADLHP